MEIYDVIWRMTDRQEKTTLDEKISTGAFYDDDTQHASVHMKRVPNITKELDDSQFVLHDLVSNLLHNDDDENNNYRTSNSNSNLQ